MRIIFSILLGILFYPANVSSVPDTAGVIEDGIIDECEELFKELELDKYIDFLPFRQIWHANLKLGINKKDILTLIDFTKPSTEERMFVIDLKERTVLFRTHVAHGRNSGDTYATSFSNASGSFKSSLGFYVTGKTYNGSNGYSLRLEGLEEGINDKAYERAIVIHGADYSNPSVIALQGRLGRSLGCPALPPSVNRPVIDVIKEGSLLYIYADNTEYFSSSPILSDFS
ncbi:MAG: murein L,D-transpeptidase catalytic domain family protein [Rikenellaceae bacterium]|nr:murein L,D-transpeptidase catalytic domain family protein [Rikenellaceae bacterium]